MKILSPSIDRFKSSKYRGKIYLDRIRSYCPHLSQHERSPMSNNSEKTLQMKKNFKKIRDSFIIYIPVINITS